MIKKSQVKFLTIAALVAAAGIVGYNVLKAKDKRTAKKKISDAMKELPHGAVKAARQLESRTLGEKFTDVASDAGDGITKVTRGLSQ
jgi:hypothetical protein